MMTGDAEADLLVDLEATVGSQHDDRGRLHRILGRKHDPTVIDPISEIGVRCASDGKVPFVEIVFKWLGVILFRGLAEFLRFLHEALNGRTP